MHHLNASAHAIVEDVGVEI